MRHASFPAGPEASLGPTGGRIYKGLPQRDVDRLMRRIGMEMELVGYGDNGLLEVEFVDDFDGEETYVTIWVEPSRIERVN